MKFMQIKLKYKQLLKARKVVCLNCTKVISDIMNNIVILNVDFNFVFEFQLINKLFYYVNFFLKRLLLTIEFHSVPLVIHILITTTTIIINSAIIHFSCESVHTSICISK